MKIRLSTVVTIGLLLGTAACHAQNLIQNGGFELPSVGGGYQFFTAMSSPNGIPNWTITSGEVDVDSNNVIPSFQGVQALDLDGMIPGTIQQTFTTIVGQKYAINFAYGNNPGIVYPNYSATVSIFNGATTIFSQPFSHNTATSGNQDYKLFGNNFANMFTANTTSSTLIFTSNDPAMQQGGVELDAISVTASTPEFGTIFSLGGLLLAGGTGLWIKRRRSVK